MVIAVDTDSIAVHHDVVILFNSCEVWAQLSNVEQTE
jgi:hypothetical protein